MRALALTLLSSSALLFPATLLAQTVDQAGADALEAQVPAVFETFLQSAPEVQLNFDGQIEAVPSGDAYSVAIPQLGVDFDGHATANIPAFTARVTPLENGWNQAQWDFPGEITVVNPRRPGQEVSITFTSDNNSMTIAPQYAMALLADYTFDDVEVTVKDQRGGLTIDTIAMSVESELSGDGPDSYDSDTQASMTGFAVNVPAEGVRIEMESLTMGGVTQGQRLDLFALLQQALMDLDPESEAFALAFLEVVRANAEEKWIGGATYETSLEGLSVRAQEGSGSIGLLELSMLAEGLDEQQADLGFELDAQDISSPQAPPQFAPVTPTVASLDVLASDVPIEALSQEVYGLLGEAPSQEELFGPKGRRAGVGNPLANLEDIDPMVFLGLVLNSDAQLLLEGLYLEAPIGYVSAQGSVEPNPQAAFQAVADFEIDIAGLPEMIAFAQSTGGAAAQASGLASMLSAMGRDGTDQDGTAIKTFDLQVTAGGQVLLNGNDMSAMMGMFQ